MILVGISTYNRPKKLVRLLSSLQIQTYKDFHTMIVFDNMDYDSQDALLSVNLPIRRMVVNDEQGFVIGCWNLIHEELYGDYNAHLMLVDDVELHPTCIGEAVRCMQEHFPDTDGIIGITQQCPGHPEYTWKEFGQVLIGRKFIERFEEVDYKVHCPKYLHFYQDEELWMYAKKLDKFKLCPTAVLDHFHPSYIREEMDVTHNVTRGKGQVLNTDKKLFLERRSKNLLWGESFD